MRKLWWKRAGAEALPMVIQPTLHSMSISCTCWVLKRRYCPQTPLQEPIGRLCLLTSRQVAWHNFSTYVIGITGRSVVQPKLVCLVSSSKGTVSIRRRYSHNCYCTLLTILVREQMRKDMSINLTIWPDSLSLIISRGTDFSLSRHV
jgi:hypothetical protein